MTTWSTVAGVVSGAVVAWLVARGAATAATETRDATVAWQYRGGAGDGSDARGEALVRRPRSAWLGPWRTLFGARPVARPVYDLDRHSAREPWPEETVRDEPWATETERAMTDATMELLTAAFPDIEWTSARCYQTTCELRYVANAAEQDSIDQLSPFLALGGDSKVMPSSEEIGDGRAAQRVKVWFFRGTISAEAYRRSARAAADQLAGELAVMRAYYAERRATAAAGGTTGGVP